MTDLSEHELNARLKGIQEGPWSRGVGKAHEALAPIGSLREAQALSLANRRKSEQLRRLLRPHFVGPSIGKKEVLTRVAVDNALTIPQLYELAIQTGYLPTSYVTGHARSFLTEYLWSEPARVFVEAYDYVAIPMLAARVGVSGFPSVIPPKPKLNASLRFAGFLAHLRSFYSDEEIAVWLEFLDDYQVESREQNKVLDYLRQERKPTPLRLPALLIGCQRFVTSLATAFNVLSDEELGPYGLMHSYWLQKFFGYKRNRQGAFVKDSAQWGDDSWAKTLCRTPILIPPDIKPRTADLVRRQFIDDIAVLEHAFEGVIQFTSRSRGDKTRVKRRPSKLVAVSTAGN